VKKSGFKSPFPPGGLSSEESSRIRIWMRYFVFCIGRLELKVPFFLYPNVHSLSLSLLLSLLSHWRQIVILVPLILATLHPGTGRTGESGPRKWESILRRHQFMNINHTIQFFPNPISSPYSSRKFLPLKETHAESWLADSRFQNNSMPWEVLNLSNAGMKYPHSNADSVNLKWKSQFNYLLLE